MVLKGKAKRIEHLHLAPAMDVHTAVATPLALADNLRRRGPFDVNLAEAKLVTCVDIATLDSSGQRENEESAMHQGTSNGPSRLFFQQSRLRPAIRDLFFFEQPADAEKLTHFQ